MKQPERRRVRKWLSVIVLLTVSLSSLSIVLHWYLRSTTGLTRIVVEGVRAATGGLSYRTVDSGTSRQVDLDFLEHDPALPRRSFSVYWRGLWRVPTPGRYDLRLGGDDLARLEIDGELVLERNAVRGMGTASELLVLEAGFHEIDLHYWQGDGGRSLTLQTAPAGQSPAPLDAYALFPERPTAATERLNTLAKAAWQTSLLAWTVLFAVLLWVAAVKHRWPSAWVQFWFPTTTTVSLAVCRIALVAAWLLFFAKPWNELALPLTYDPTQIGVAFVHGVLAVVPVEIFHTYDFLRSVWLATTAAGVLAAIGLFTRTSLLAFGLGNTLLIAHLWSYGEWHHTEALYCIALVLLGLSPSGRCYSLDSLIGRRSKHPERWGPDARTDTGMWALRLVQCLMAIAYFSAGSSKLLDGGLAWVNGATLQTIVLGDYARFGMPLSLWLAQSFWLCVVAAVATIVIEVFFFVAVFVPGSRKYLLPGGAAMHVGIFVAMAAPFLTWVALYVTFVDFERLRHGSIRRIRGMPRLTGPVGLAKGPEATLR